MKKPPHKRRLTRRDADEKVDRALATHCQHLPCVTVESKLVDGMTMRQTVTQDTKEAHSQNKKLGLMCPYVFLALKITKRLV